MIFGSSEATIHIENIGDTDMTANQYPCDLAAAVRSYLLKHEIESPSQDILTDLFEILYFTSLRTEELHSIVGHIIFLDPKNPDPAPPERMVRDRWTFIPFDCPVPFDQPTLVKLAQASDPRTSSFAVYHDRHKQLHIWGLVDQANRRVDFVNYDIGSGSPPPGIFQASIEGTGHLAAYVEFSKIAELKNGSLLQQPPDVLRQGPVLEQLTPGIVKLTESIRAEVPHEVYSDRLHWDDSLASAWTESLYRLLLRARNYRHGGAVLITPDSAHGMLNIKYEINYDRLQSALKAWGLFCIENTHSCDLIAANYLDEEADNLPVPLYLDESVSDFELRDTQSELDGIIWFISLLTRVDGLVLMDPHLAVKGFGVEIVVDDVPETVYVASNAAASRKRKADYNHYGTRHRSMMRYCAAVPGSVGFVISQDGDVRAITNVAGSLVMWENIKLQRYFEARIPRLARTG
jgi:hypothetical protein